MKEMISGNEGPKCRLVQPPQTLFGIFAVKGLGLFCSMLLISAGIVLFLKCRLGSDPQTLLYDGISVFCGISYSMAAGIYSWTVFLIAFLFARQYFGFGTVFSALTLSFFIGFYERVFGNMDFEALSYGWRVVIMAAGQVIMSIGMMLSVWIDFGMGCSLALLYKVCDLTGIQFRVLKTGNDILFAAVGFFMGGVLGIGTVFSALVTGIMMSWFRTLLDRHLFPMPKLPDKIFHK